MFSLIGIPQVKLYRGNIIPRPSLEHPATTPQAVLGTVLQKFYAKMDVGHMKTGVCKKTYCFTSLRYYFVHSQEFKIMHPTSICSGGHA